ncbi:myb/SANT-like DNA-binding domain-containing protein 3 [Prorops nasuta]|uniref:myb/SANT-like DNA-binding domain-containing protein 3 n=1 Tax=Prorops nasuta TaxID=863751 RepID=UPI0034CEEA22
MSNSSENKEKLLSIIEKYFKIIENKMTNGNTLAQKEKAWQKIRAEVKEKIGGQWEKICPKSSWTHMKLQARKYKAATRSELYKTGGGKSVAPVYEPFLEKITSLIGKSAMGQCR